MTSKQPPYRSGQNSAATSKTPLLHLTPLPPDRCGWSWKNGLKLKTHSEGEQLQWKPWSGMYLDVNVSRWWNKLILLMTISIYNSWTYLQVFLVRHSLLEQKHSNKSKNFPTYPWNIPQTPNQQFMKEFLSFGEAWGMLQGYVGVPLEYINLIRSES